MAGILDILIEVLNIDCSIAQCTGYASEIESMFYLFFFPTIFIILFIYILTNFIFRGGGAVKGLRMLISIGAYAFIVFEGLFTMFVSLSRLWWLLTILLVGLFAFIRYLFKGGDEGKKGGLPWDGGGAESVLSRLKGKAHQKFLEKTGLENKEEEIRRRAREEEIKVSEKYKKDGWDGLTYDEKILFLAYHGISAKKKTDLDKLYKTLRESGTL